MEKIYAYIRQNVFAFTLGAGVLLWFGYQTFAGRECFNCEQTETYKSDSRQNAGLRFRHK